MYCLATIINYAVRGHLLKYIQCKKWNPSKFKLIKFVLFDSFFVSPFILFFIKHGATPQNITTSVCNLLQYMYGHLP